MYKGDAIIVSAAFRLHLFRECKYYFLSNDALFNPSAIDQNVIFYDQQAQYAN